MCGQIQTRSYTDNQGNKRYATEVLAEEVSFVASKESGTEPKNTATAGGSYIPDAYKQPTATQSQFETVTDDSDLPF